MGILEKVTAFMGVLADHSAGLRHEVQVLRRELHQERTDMAATLQSIKDKLAQQSAQIDQLAAEKAANEQADLNAIDAAVDENTAKLTTALQPAGQV